MKSKIKYIIAILLLLILIIIYNVYKIYVLNYYSSDHFSLDFNRNWYIKEKNNDSLILNNKSGSSIGILCKDIIDEEKSKDIDEIYFDYEEDFRVSNKFKLINYGKSKVGRDYIDGVEYLYEYKGAQILLILVKKDNLIYEINYNSSSQNFDLNIEEFYDIINSVSFF